MTNRNFLSLLDLKNKLQFTFDTYDDEICASVYFELDEIPNTILNRFEVVSIDNEKITCRITQFLRDEIKSNPKRLKNYLEECYHAEQYIAQFFGADDICDDGGEAVYTFIECDLYDYISGRCG